MAPARNDSEQRPREGFSKPARGRRAPTPVTKLRRKFIAVAILSLAGTLAVICLAIYLFFSLSVAQRADSIIGTLHENGGSFPPAEAQRELTLDMTFAVNTETPYENRYAWVRFNADGSIAETNETHIARLDEEQVQDVAEQVRGSGEQRGWHGYYRYGVFDEGDGSMVIFLDCYLRQQTVYVVMRISVVVSFLCLVMVALLLIPLSHKIARPFSRNLERQQRFVTDASHELKTPLAIISANNALTERLSGETQWTRSTKSQVARLSQLIRDLIDIARASEAADPSSFPVINLSQLVERTVEDFRPLAEVAGKQIEGSVAQGVEVRGSSEELERLLSILLSNAVKHGDEAGRIAVHLETNRKAAILRVDNPAVDLDPKEANRLFDRFYRADASRSRETGGYGIGLSVAQSIAERHGGKLVAVKEGNLLALTLTLPHRS